MKAIVLAFVALALAGSARAADEIRVVKAPSAEWNNRSYTANPRRSRSSALAKLPIGAITPRGWLRSQLMLEADGMTGHLEEISRWCNFDNTAWADPNSSTKQGWEELPYWLKGYGDLGYVLKDEKIIAETKRWIEVMMKSQDETGWFGPRALLHSRDCDGHADIWPNMLVLNILQSWYEYSRDERVIPFMSRYFKWELDYPEKDFLHGYWPRIRIGDNLESVYWLYNRTGDNWLLDLAKKIHEHGYDWTNGPPNLHNVNFAQSFREPAEYWQQAKDDKFLSATQRQYDTVMGTWGQVPGGGFGGDENARKGYIDPRQGFETCGIVEFMHSFEMLEKMTGDPRWIDRCEELAFNSLPAAMTPDLKGLHYLTCPNQVILDRANKSPGVQNRGTMFSYSPGAVYRCCQHNVAMGWPYYAEELWLATGDNGLCASIYNASDVSAKVGDGTQIAIAEETDYPFSDTIQFKVTTPKATKFPLYLRVPDWSDAPQVQINDQPTQVQAQPDTFLVIDRSWENGDRVTLRLPMKISLRVWHKNKDSISVDRGPLTFSLNIGETWRQYGRNNQWPDYEVFPATPWNYGLVVDEKEPAKWFEVIQKPGPLAQQPFTPQDVPIELRTKGKQVPQWKTDTTGLIEPLQQSPVKSDQPVQDITLIPMGAARLRISAFPVIGEGVNAHQWESR